MNSIISGGIAIAMLSLYEPAAIAEESDFMSQPDDVVTPVVLRNAAVVPAVNRSMSEPLRNAPVELGQHGGAEFAGALVLTGFLLRAARRRGVI